MKVRGSLNIKGSTSDSPCILSVQRKPKMIPGSIHIFWYEGFPKNKENIHVRKDAYIPQK